MTLKRRMSPAVGLLLLMCRQGDSLPQPKDPQPARSREHSTPPATRALQPASAFESIADPAQRSVRLFDELGKVLLHPRCVNCHPAQDRPRQGEGSLPHQPFVVRAEDGKGAPGLPCSSCHGASNFLNVPGRENWHLAPAEMAWEGRTSAQLCRQLKDPQRNGARSLDELLEHVAQDELVAYGWAPPAHLAKAPGSQDSFARLFEAWIAAGAGCPPER